MLFFSVSYLFVVIIWLYTKKKLILMKIHVIWEEHPNYIKTVLSLIKQKHIVFIDDKPYRFTIQSPVHVFGIPLPHIRRSIVMILYPQPFGLARWWNSKNTLKLGSIWRLSVEMTTMCQNHVSVLLLLRHAVKKTTSRNGVKNVKRHPLAPCIDRKCVS